MVPPPGLAKRGLPRNLAAPQGAKDGWGVVKLVVGGMGYAWLVALAPTITPVS